VSLLSTRQQERKRGENREKENRTRESCLVFLSFSSSYPVLSRRTPGDKPANKASLWSPQGSWILFPPSSHRNSLLTTQSASVSWVIQLVITEPPHPSLFVDKFPSSGMSVVVITHVLTKQFYLFCLAFFQLLF